MVRIVLARPGSTELDEQERIKGTLDMPLSDHGNRQIAETARELAAVDIQIVYTSPCQAAFATGRAIGEFLGVKVKQLDKLQNLNQGLWQGKRIDEVRQKQPKIYRRWQDNPETVCPPDGEMLEQARDRIQSTLTKVLKKHKNGVIALVVPEPLASLIRNFLDGAKLGDLWKVECDCGNWEFIDVESEAIVTG